MPFAFSADDAREYVTDFGWLPIEGDPAHTVADYVSTRTPAWGVVSDAGNDRHIMTYFGPTGELWVVDISDLPSQVASLSRPPYTTEDQSLLHNIADTILTDALAIGPTIRNLIDTGIDVLRRTALAIPNLVPNGNLLLIAAVVLGVAYMSGGGRRR